MLFQRPLRFSLLHGLLRGREVRDELVAFLVLLTAARWKLSNYDYLDASTLYFILSNERRRIAV